MDVPPKSFAEVIAELEVTIRGLKLDVNAWCQRVGSETHFMTLELDRLLDLLEEVKQRQMAGVLVQ